MNSCRKDPRTFYFLTTGSLAGGRRGQGGNLPCSVEGGRQRREIRGQGARGGRGTPTGMLGRARGGREMLVGDSAGRGGGGARRRRGSDEGIAMGRGGLAS